MYPGQIVTSFFIDDEEPQAYLWLAPSWAALKADPGTAHFIICVQMLSVGETILTL